MLISKLKSDLFSDKTFLQREKASSLLLRHGFFFSFLNDPWQNYRFPKCLVNLDNVVWLSFTLFVWKFSNLCKSRWYKILHFYIGSTIVQLTMANLTPSKASPPSCYNAVSIFRINVLVPITNKSAFKTWPHGTSLKPKQHLAFTGYVLQSLGKFNKHLCWTFWNWIQSALQVSSILGEICQENLTLNVGTMLGKIRTLGCIVLQATS